MNIAVVTGASSGIGLEFVKQLENNQNIDAFWLIARREDRLNELKESLKKAAKVIPLDLSKNQDLDKYLNLLKSENPNITYLINAAGYGKFGSFKEVNTNTAFNMIDLNVKAMVFVSQESIPFMKKGAKIIQIGSASTYNPLPNFNIYASTKSFLKHYSRALHRELKEFGISVTTVCPGWVKTDFFNRADIETDSKNSFAKPMVEAKDVVKKAIKDANKGKDISMYGWYNNLHHFLSKILPHALLISIWQNMQKS